MFWALRSRDEISKKVLGELYDNIGMNLRNNFRYEEARIYYQKSLEVRDEIKDIEGLTNVILNMGCMHRDIANGIVDSLEINIDEFSKKSNEEQIYLRSLYDSTLIYFDSVRTLLKNESK